MKRRKILSGAFLFLLTASLVLAYQGPFAQNEAVHFPSACLMQNGTTFSYVESESNITIYYPNGSEFVVDQPMQNISTGKFIYNFTTPNTTGTYFVEKECVLAGGTSSYGSDSFEIIDLEERTGMAAIAQVIGVITLVAFLVFIGQDLIKKNTWYMQLYGIGTYLLSGIAFLFIPYLLMTFSIGTAYFGPMKALFIGSLIIFGALFASGILWMLGMLIIKPAELTIQSIKGGGKK